MRALLLGGRAGLLHGAGALEDHGVGGPLAQHALREARHVEADRVPRRPPPRHLRRVVQHRRLPRRRVAAVVEVVVVVLVARRGRGRGREEEHAVGAGGAVLGDGDDAQDDAELFAKTSSLRAEEECKKRGARQVLADHPCRHLPLIFSEMRERARKTMVALLYFQGKQSREKRPAAEPALEKLGQRAGRNLANLNLPVAKWELREFFTLNWTLVGYLNFAHLFDKCVPLLRKF